jgi:biopolymer transport protein TolR
MAMDMGGKSVKADINVTPLVDVVLVLLIIFMVITPMLHRGKPVVLPHAKLVSALKHGGDPILLSITADGRLYVDKKQVERRELAAALEDEMAAMPGAPIILKGDRALEYRTVREVFAELSKARIGGVSLAATPIRPGDPG